MSGRQVIQITLQHNRSGGLVHFLFSFFTPDASLDQEPLRLGRGESFVPRLDRHNGFVLQHRDEFLNLQRRRTVAAVHVPRESNENQSHLFVLYDFLEPFEKLYERFRWNELQRRGNHLQFITHRDADAFGSMIEGENAHDFFGPLQLQLLHRLCRRFDRLLDILLTVRG